MYENYKLEMCTVQSFKTSFFFITCYLSKICLFSYNINSSKMQHFLTSIPAEQIAECDFSVVHMQQFNSSTQRFAAIYTTPRLTKIVSLEAHFIQQYSWVTNCRSPIAVNMNAFHKKLRTCNCHRRNYQANFSTLTQSFHSICNAKTRFYNRTCRGKTSYGRRC